MKPRGGSEILLSVVVPMFNEEALVDAFYQRLSAVLRQRPESSEIIVVDDGSRDQTLSLWLARRREDLSIKIIEFSRNFGHQSAIMAGLNHASGRACVVLDGDLQDPPELIPEMLEMWKKGFEVVYAQRRRREGEGIFKRVTAALFYKIFRALAGVEVPLDTGDFRLMDRAVVDALCGLSETNRFIRGLVCWVGFRQTGILYDRSGRAAGETKYPLWKMVRLALDGLTSFSRLPLRLVTLTGMLFCLGSFILGCWALYVKLFTSHGVRGWTSLIAVVLLMGGTQLLCVGVLGEYVARIFDEVKSRPAYITRRRWGWENSEEGLK